jgi:hypothetical protein
MGGEQRTALIAAYLANMAATEVALTSIGKPAVRAFDSGAGSFNPRAPAARVLGKVGPDAAEALLALNDLAANRHSHSP